MACSILQASSAAVSASTPKVTLTDEGLAVAEKIYQRHTLLTRLLVTLGVDEKTAAEDACKMEHAISDVSMDAIKKFIERK